MFMNINDFEQFNIKKHKPINKLDYKRNHSWKDDKCVRCGIKKEKAFNEMGYVTVSCDEYYVNHE